MTENWTLLQDLVPEYAIRLLAAVVCGIILGIERERRDKPAGLRTIVLITVGATVYMLVSELIPVLAEGPDATTRADPARIAAQVVTGVGFLGAGTIIQARGSVHGLTTAAVIWVSAGIGLVAGVGFPLVAVGTTLLVLLVLVSLNPLSSWLGHRGSERTLRISVPNDTLTLERVQHLVDSHGSRREAPEPELAESGRLGIEIHYRDAGSSTRRFLESLAAIDGVRGVTVEES